MTLQDERALATINQLLAYHTSSTRIHFAFAVWQAAEEHFAALHPSEAAPSNAVGEDSAVPVSRDSAACLPCGHHPSLLLMSAETGEPLYCELCDDKSGRRDAEQREQELSALIRACEPYLKEGETPAERIERERADTDAVLTLLVREKNKVAAPTAAPVLNAGAEPENSIQSNEAKRDGDTAACLKAVEFAEYMAKDAEQLLASLNVLHAAKEAAADQTVDQIEAAEHAQEAVADHWRGLESTIYEFRKRAEKVQKRSGEAEAPEPNVQKEGAPR